MENNDMDDLTITTIRDLLSIIIDLKECTTVNFETVKSIASTIDLLTNRLDGNEGTFTPSEYAEKIIDLLGLKSYVDERAKTKIDDAILLLAEMIQITPNLTEGGE